MACTHEQALLCYYNRKLCRKSEQATMPKNPKCPNVPIAVDEWFSLYDDGGRLPFSYQKNFSFFIKVLAKRWLRA